MKRKYPFHPTCPSCGLTSRPTAEHCNHCGKFLLVMPRAEWEAYLRELHAMRRDLDNLQRELETA
jgi:hypothetical protein